MERPKYFSLKVWTSLAPRKCFHMYSALILLWHSVTNIRTRDPIRKLFVVYITVMYFVT